MPLPNPKKDEEKNDFMNRCMSDATMNKEFKDNKQRVAVCMAQYDRKDESKANWAKESYSLKNPKKADLNKDGKISSYEKKRGEAIEKSQKQKGDKSKKKGLSDKQKKLPPALQKAIMKKQSKADMDYEGEMARVQLMKIAENAAEIASMISSPDQQLEAWVQDKISVSEHHMQAVRDYMKYGNAS